MHRIAGILILSLLPVGYRQLHRQCSPCSKIGGRWLAPVSTCISSGVSEAGSIQ